MSSLLHFNGMILKRLCTSQDENLESYSSTTHAGSEQQLLANYYTKQSDDIVLLNFNTELDFDFLAWTGLLISREVEKTSSTPITIALLAILHLLVLYKLQLHADVELAAAGDEVNYV